MILYHKKDLSVRNLEPEDAKLLVKWLSDPVVLEYYEGRDRPHDLAMVQEHFYEDTPEGMIRAIVRYGSEDIGYVQFYPIDDDERAEYGYTDFAGSIYGMDQFIGEPRLWNKGIGSQLVRETVIFLLEITRADKIVMDPQCWNHRALRVYEKNGFVRKKLLPEHEWHEGEYKDCWLIEYCGT
ncbi:GNAT family N-acetyltransferase [Paenibacillus sp. P3E]|nr:GNAT family N-acetyltransferase [Paenibacillus sp. P3E]